MEDVFKIQLLGVICFCFMYFEVFHAFMEGEINGIFLLGETMLFFSGILCSRLIDDTGVFMNSQLSVPLLSCICPSRLDSLCFVLFYVLNTSAVNMIAPR